MFSDALLVFKIDSMCLDILLVVDIVLQYPMVSHCQHTIEMSKYIILPLFRTLFRRILLFFLRREKNTALRLRATTRLRNPSLLCREVIVNRCFSLAVELRRYPRDMG